MKEWRKKIYNNLAFADECIAPEFIAINSGCLIKQLSNKYNRMIAIVYHPPRRLIPNRMRCFRPMLLMLVGLYVENISPSINQGN